MQPHSLLKQQKRAADRSAACSVLARLRTFQGYLGAAKFYQYEAARWHVRACELREQCSAAPAPVHVQIYGRQYRITDYVPPADPVTVDLSIYGSKPMAPEAFEAFVKTLDNPPAPNEALKRLMSSKSPWPDGNNRPWMARRSAWSR